MTPEPQQIVSREFEHVRVRIAATNAKPAKRIQLVAGRWPDWVTGRDERDAAPEEGKAGGAA